MFESHGSLYKAGQSTSVGAHPVTYSEPVFSRPYRKERNYLSSEWRIGRLK